MPFQSEDRDGEKGRGEGGGVGGGIATCFRCAGVGDFVLCGGGEKSSVLTCDWMAG